MIGADLLPAGEIDTANSEDRRGVSHAAGLQVAAELFELVGGLVQGDLQIHPLLGAEIGEPQPLAPPPARIVPGTRRNCPGGG